MEEALFPKYSRGQLPWGVSRGPMATSNMNLMSKVPIWRSSVAMLPELELSTRSYIRLCPLLTSSYKSDAGGGSRDSTFVLLRTAMTCEVCTYTCLALSSLLHNLNLCLPLSLDLLLVLSFQPIHDTHILVTILI